MAAARSGLAEASLNKAIEQAGVWIIPTDQANPAQPHQVGSLGQCTTMVPHIPVPVPP